MLQMQWHENKTDHRAYYFREGDAVCHKGLQGCSDKENRWKRNVGAFAMSALIVFCIDSKLIHVRRNLRKKYRI